MNKADSQTETNSRGPNSPKSPSFPNASKASNELSFEWKRTIVGGVAAACLVFAAVTYAMSPDLNNVALAMSTRIGLVLFVSWLAMPQLKSVLLKLPSILPVMLLAMIVFLAARPSVFRIVGSLIVIVTALLGISNWIKRVTAKK